MKVREIINEDAERREQMDAAFRNVQKQAEKTYGKQDPESRAKRAKRAGKNARRHQHRNKDEFAKVDQSNKEIITKAQEKK